MNTFSIYGLTFSSLHGVFKNRNSQFYGRAICLRNFQYDYITKSNRQIQCNLHQNLNEIPHRNRKNNHKIHMKTQKIPNTQSNPEKKEQCWRYHNTQFQIMLQSHGNKTVWHWHKNRHIDQWNRIVELEISQCSYNKVTKIYVREMTPCSTNELGKLAIERKKCETRFLPLSCKQIN
jgi:hypothetical protein